MWRLSVRPWRAWRTWLANCAGTATASTTSMPAGGWELRTTSRVAAEFSANVAAYARALAAPLRNLKVRLLLEPGRSIIGPAGVLVTSVIYRKENDGKRFLVVDAAMNDLIRPALYGAYHEIVPVYEVRTGRNLKREMRGYGYRRPRVRDGRFFRARSRTAVRRRRRPAGDSGCWRLRNGAGVELQHAPTAGGSAGHGQVGEGDSAAGEDLGPAARRSVSRPLGQAYAV